MQPCRLSAPPNHCAQHIVRAIARSMFEMREDQVFADMSSMGEIQLEILPGSAMLLWELAHAVSDAILISVDSWKAPK